MNKKLLQIVLLLSILILSSLACRVAVDYDGDGVVPGVPTNTPSNKIEEIVIDKPTAFIESTATPNCPLSAEILSMFSIPEGFSFAYDSEFIMVWEIKNNGCGDWDDGIYLQNVSGDEIAQVLQVPVPALKSGESVTLQVPMTVKNIIEPTYQSVWQLTTSSNEAFGPEFLAIIFIDTTTIPKSSDNEEIIIIDAKPKAGEIEIISGPDIITQSVEIAEAVSQDGLINVGVSILNQGVEDMNEFKIQCVLDETNIKDEQVLSYIETNQIETVYCLLPTPENLSLFSITILLDYENAQPELDETNNIDTYTFTMTMTP